MKETKDIDVGKEAKSFLCKAASVSTNEKLVFGKNWDFLVATIAKRFIKSPQRHKIMCAAASIVPGTMSNARSVSEKRMEFKFYLKKVAVCSSC